MFRMLIPLILPAIIITHDVTRADPVADAIASGEYERAAEVLDSLVEEKAVGRAEQAFWEGILAESADESYRLLADAVSLGLDSVLEDRAIERIEEYRLLIQDMTGSTRLSDSIVTTGFRERTARIRSFEMAMRGEVDSALKIIDAWIAKSRGSEKAQWWQIDKARTMLLAQKLVGATKVLKSLTKEPKGEGVPMALFLLAKESLAKHETDKAALYFNLLRDGYPNAVGTDEIVDHLSEVEEPAVSSSKAEKITGTYYSVQVGVFSNPENAKRGAEQFEKYKMPVEIAKKKISNVMYNVVFVGHFSEYHEALRAKTMLEENHNESFQVIAR